MSTRVRDRHFHGRAINRAVGGAPMKVVDVDLAQPLPVITAGIARGAVPHESARVLVRLHGTPIGVVVVDLRGGEVSAEVLGERIRQELTPAVARHLTEDGLDPTGRPGTNGSSTTEEPACRRVPDEADCPLITVVVTSGGRLDRLSGCIDAVLANDHARFEILVVDDHPAEPAVRDLVDQQHAADRRVRYLREYGPGRSRARNTGYAMSRGDMVAFIDDDSRPDQGWLRAIAAAFVSQPEAAIVTGPVLALELDTPGQVALEAAHGITGGWDRREFDLEPQAEVDMPYPFVPGLFGSADNLAVRKRMLPDLWGFDVNLGPGTPGRAGEDLDVFVDTLFRGDQIVFEPRALVHRYFAAGLHDLEAHLRDEEVGWSAMLTKQLVASRGHRTRVLRRLPGALAAAASPAEPRTPGHRSRRVLHLALGPVAYVRSRLSNSWATA